MMTGWSLWSSRTHTLHQELCGFCVSKRVIARPLDNSQLISNSMIVRDTLIYCYVSTSSKQVHSYAPKRGPKQAHTTASLQ
jgi:hypothetical protein